MVIEIVNSRLVSFITHSNMIGGVTSEIALHDSLDAWDYGIKNINRGVNKELILKLHKKIMYGLDKDIAGKFRTVPVWVGNRKCLDHWLIEEKIDKWVKKYGGSRKSYNIKEAHIQFELIHPFIDGNGRTGRMIMNLQRARSGLPILIIHYGFEQHNHYKWFHNEELKL